MSYSNTRKLIHIIYLGIIIGFIYGLIVSLNKIYLHDYVNYELNNLILLELQSSLTKYSVIFILIVLVCVVPILLLQYLYKRSTLKKNILSKDLIRSAIISFIYLIIIGIVFGFYYTDIEFYILKGPEKYFFKKFDIGGTIINLGLFGIISYIILLSATYAVLKLNVITKISNIIDSRAISRTAAILLVMVVLLNLFTYVYRSQNTTREMNVILISIDTLRADHLGSYGYDRDTSPNIDRLAQKAILYENAYSQAPWTLPSMASMMTSLYPKEHGAMFKDTKLKNNVLTIAEYMKNDLYKTIAVVSNRFVSDMYGFSQGFDIFNKDLVGGHGKGKTSDKISERAIKYIENNKNNKFFLWMHFMDPHGYYIEHPEFGYSSNYSGQLKPLISARELNKKLDTLDENDIQFVRDLYDEEISFTDKHIGRVLDYLGDSGLLDNTIIIVTADHGEEFMDRDKFGHGKTVYQELIHVPLIIYIPGKEEHGALRVKTNVEVRSIAKTIAELNGAKTNDFNAENLLVTATEGGSYKYSLSQKLSNSKIYPRSNAIILGPWKLIKKIPNSTFELYDLETDPGEKQNLFGSEAPDIDIIQEQLISGLSILNTDREAELEKVELSKEHIEQFKALGYIE